jgi:hypothetical protein
MAKLKWFAVGSTKTNFVVSDEVWLSVRYSAFAAGARFYIQYSSLFLYAGLFLP